MVDKHSSVVGILAEGVTSLFSGPGSDSSIITSAAPVKQERGIRHDNAPKAGIASILSGPEGMA